eukprot:Nk52_evm31s1524 gene=Nk52_evmTU31s1524
MSLSPRDVLYSKPLIRLARKKGEGWEHLVHWRESLYLQPLISQQLQKSKSENKKKRKKNSDGNLEKWYYEKLPELVKQQGCLRHENLVQIMKWKLRHGKFRPRLLNLIESNSAEQVEATTKSVYNQIQKAMQVEGDQKEREKSKGHLDENFTSAVMKELSILGSFCNKVPYFSDEAVFEACFKGNLSAGSMIKYTLSFYTQQFLANIQAKCSELQAVEALYAKHGQGQKEEEEYSGKSYCNRDVIGLVRAYSALHPVDWDEQKVEKALWANAMLRKQKAELIRPLESSDADDLVILAREYGIGESPVKRMKR